MRKFTKYPVSYVKASETGSALPEELCQLITHEFEVTDTGFAVEHTILDILAELPGVTGTDEYFMNGYVGVSFVGSASTIFNHLLSAYQDNSGMVVAKYKANEFYIEGTDGSGDTWISVSKDPRGNTYSSNDKAYAVHIEYAE